MTRDEMESLVDIGDRHGVSVRGVLFGKEWAVRVDGNPSVVASAQTAYADISTASTEMLASPTVTAGFFDGALDGLDGDALVALLSKQAGEK